MFNMIRVFTIFHLWLLIVTLLINEPIVVFGNDFERVLGEDPQDVLNKTLASKASTIRSDGLGTSRVPAVLYFSTPKYSGPPLLEGVDAASHPPNRGSFFTPPLPKDQFNFPFADKRTLRGSNSDPVVANRRPQLPPISTGKGEKERIPIKRPDLVAPFDTKKKTINTINSPSVHKFPEGLNYSEPSSTSSTTVQNVNDTLDVVVPAIPNISYKNILRILNGNNKHDFVEHNKAKIDQELTTPKHSSATSKPSSSPATIHSLYEEEKRHQSVEYSYPVNMDQNQDNQDVAMKEEQMTDEVNDYQPPPVKSVHESTEVNLMPEHPEPRARYILGIAWDIHVYLIAVLFAILACISALSLVRIRAFKWLLPYGYFFAVHSLLTVIGAIRSVYLFYDAYNISKSFSEPLSRLMLNVVFPFLVCIFALMFLFILKLVDLQCDLYYAQKSNILLPLVIGYLLFSVCIDLYADLMPYSSTMILLSQCLFIILCVVLGITYIAFYKYTSRSSFRKQNSVYGTAFTDPLRPSVAHTIRVMLATSLLSLLMAVIQLIGMFCIYDPLNKDQPHPWLWWAFQLSVRVIEVSICFLIFWAAVQPLRGEDEKETQSHNSASGFPLFPWGVGGTPRDSDHSQADDMYPTICSANQAIHNYTLRTGKPMYEDILQYCHQPPSHLVTPVPTHLLSQTTDRRSFKRHPLDGDPMRPNCGTLNGYPDRGPYLPQSPSMLIDEEGIVRFRSIADAELHAAEEEDTYSRVVSHPNDNYSSI